MQELMDRKIDFETVGLDITRPDGCKIVIKEFYFKGSVFGLTEVLSVLSQSADTTIGNQDLEEMLNSITEEYVDYAEEDDEINSNPEQVRGKVRDMNGAIEINGDTELSYDEYPTKNRLGG